MTTFLELCAVGETAEDTADGETKSQGNVSPPSSHYSAQYEAPAAPGSPSAAGLHCGAAGATGGAAGRLRWLLGTFHRPEASSKCGPARSKPVGTVEEIGSFF